MTVKLVYPFASARIGVSRGVIEDLALLSGLKRSSFDVVHNPAAVTPTAACASFNFERDVKIILGVGTLKPAKDFVTLIRAFALLPSTLECRLVLLGDGRERRVLEELAIELQIRDKVLFLGKVLDTSPYYNTASVFVMSSRQEGFGNVIVEALSHGVPVVSTNCRSGPSEILVDGEFGALVPVGNSRLLAEAIEQTLKEDVTVKRERLRARARDFHPTVIAKSYLEIMGLGALQHEND